MNDWMNVMNDCRRLRRCSKSLCNFFRCVYIYTIHVCVFREAEERGDVVQQTVSISLSMYVCEWDGDEDTMTIIFYSNEEEEEDTFLLLLMTMRDAGIVFFFFFFFFVRRSRNNSESLLSLSSLCWEKTHTHTDRHWEREHTSSSLKGRKRETVS